MLNEWVSYFGSMDSGFSGVWCGYEWAPRINGVAETNLRIAILGLVWADRDCRMSNIVTMKCDLGHTWLLPLSNTSHVVMPDRCPKCIKQPTTVVIAVVVFEDNGSPSVMIDKQ